MHLRHPLPIVVAVREACGRERRLEVVGRERRRAAGAAPRHKIVPVRGQLRGQIGLGCEDLDSCGGKVGWGVRGWLAAGAREAWDVPC
jgi:hypothetical protein